MNWFNWIIVFHNLICYTKIVGNDNYPNYLTVMVNCHYHGGNRVITQ